jgi:hypothetical protein
MRISIVEKRTCWRHFKWFFHSIFVASTNRCPAIHFQILNSVRPDRVVTNVLKEITGSRPPPLPLPLSLLFPFWGKKGDWQLDTYHASVNPSMLILAFMRKNSTFEIGETSVLKGPQVTWNIRAKLRGQAPTRIFEVPNMLLGGLSTRKLKGHAKFSKRLYSGN